MNKNKKEKEWKATSKMLNEQNNINDIANLNDDDSFLPIEEEEKTPLTEEEKTEVRKKLFILLILIIVTIIGLLIILIFNPFSSNKQKQHKEKIENEEFKDEQEELKEEDKKIIELNDGNIKLENKELQGLIWEITYQPKDYYENDTTSLFKNNNINQLEDKSKLFLMSKTNDFKTLINNKINSDFTCATDIIIDTNSINEIIEKRLNTSVNKYENFLYNIYKDNNYVNTIEFTYQNNQYMGKCHTTSEDVINLVQQKVISATKENKKLYIDAKVVFINKNGVYKDYNFSNLITNKDEKYDSYIEKGNTYRYTYDIKDSTYSLVNVSLLTE